MPREKKLTNMIWRSMGESILFSLFLFALITYFLDIYGYMKPFKSWSEGIEYSLLNIGLVSAAGAVFGFWYSMRIKRKLEHLRSAMLLLEKGNLSPSISPQGEDEIGRLGQQLSKISRKWEEQVSTLQRLSTHNAELAEKAKLSAVVEERQRLARDLHDAVSQQLFAISMTATAAMRTLDKDFDKAKRQISLIEEMASVAQSEMRALLLHLRPVHLEGKSLSAGLHELLQELRAKVPIEISADITPDIVLSRGVEDHLFRIVQEALSNTLRHSKATKMEVRLYKLGKIVILSIHDNGVGFDLQVTKHASYGLSTMQERVVEVGGTMNLLTAPGKGTRIDIRIPIIHEKGESGHVKQ